MLSDFFMLSDNIKQAIRQSYKAIGENLP